jgi:hypothetical protein
VDDQTDAGQFANAGRADEDSRQEIQVEATVAVPEEVRDAVHEGLTKLGQGIQSLRRSARDAIPGLCCGMKKADCLLLRQSGRVSGLLSEPI